MRYPQHFALDYDEYLTPPTMDSEMTLTYALIADGGIVVAADSQRTRSHTVLNENIASYIDETNKIKCLPDGAVLTLAGNDGFLNSLLLKVGTPDGFDGFEEMVKHYQFKFEAYRHSTYGQKPNPEAEFLFCGYDQINGIKTPRIVKLSARNWFMWEDVPQSGFTGREKHGAVLYLHHRLFRPNMPLDAAQCLAYCILSEVSELDSWVGGQIVMKTVTPDGIKMISDDDFKRYDEKRQAIHRTVAAFLG